MLNTYNYHQLPPVCFGVCYTIFSVTFTLLAEKLKPSDPTILNLSIVKKGKFRIVGSQHLKIYISLVWVSCMSNVFLLVTTIFFEQVKQRSPWRWCNKHRKMWEVIGDKFMYLTYYIHLVEERKKWLTARTYGVETFKTISDVC